MAVDRWNEGTSVDATREKKRPERRSIHSGATA
jgi:hypothetical protein